MSNVPQRLALPSSRNLLSRVLDQPNLPAQIQSLAPSVFCQLVDRVGLEDAGEVLALATTEQLAHAFDEDLWKNQRPGEEEQFDADRFRVWLEVLLEAGDGFVASKLAEMPEDLVTLALHKHMLVLDVENLALDMQSADEVDARQLDKALESCLYEELNGYQLMARDPDGWDSILSAVLALDRDHHEFLQRVLEHCCAMTQEYIDDNGGLYEVLTSEEMLEADVAGDREDRRAEMGHVPPSSAAAFLKIARGGTGVADKERDPITVAYFRSLRPTPQRQRATPTRAEAASAADGPGGVLQVLKDADVLDQPSLPHLLGPGAAADPRESLLVDAMRQLADQNPEVFQERSEELAFLTNVLLSGCSLQEHRLRPIEAVRAAISVCNLGLCLQMDTGNKTRASALSAQALKVLSEARADRLFRAAWERVHTEIVDRAARVARGLFARAASHAQDEEDRVAFKRAGAALRKACDAGEPWRAAAVLDGLMGADGDGIGAGDESLDEQDVGVLRGLIDECPTLPASANGAMRFLATPDRLVEARETLDRLERLAGLNMAEPSKPSRRPDASKTTRRR